MNDLDTIAFNLGRAVWIRERCPECLRTATHAVCFAIEGTHEEGDYYAMCADHVDYGVHTVTDYQDGEVVGVYELADPRDPPTREDLQAALTLAVEKEIRRRVLAGATPKPDRDREPLHLPDTEESQNGDETEAKPARSGRPRRKR